MSDNLKKFEAIKSTNIEGVLEVIPTIGDDKRGYIYTFYQDGLLPTKFVEDKISWSKTRVFRGMHGDGYAHKYITCIYGMLQLVVLDARKNSPTRGQVFSTLLDSNNATGIYVPAGCLNGHLCLTNTCGFLYKWSEPYTGPGHQATIRWDNPVLKDVDWEVHPDYFILSERDQVDTEFESIQL